MADEKYGKSPLLDAWRAQMQKDMEGMKKATFAQAGIPKGMLTTIQGTTPDTGRTLRPPLPIHNIPISTKYAASFTAYADPNLGRDWLRLANGVHAISDDDGKEYKFKLYRKNAPWGDG